jgi:glycine dehydrogenase subunit 2
MNEPLIFERSTPGRQGVSLPPDDLPEYDIASVLPGKFMESSPPSLPEVSEGILVRHYTNLSKKNFCIDTHFYPLGSCTMKYNPKINETLAALEAFTHTHPYQPTGMLQGILTIAYELGEMLKELTGLHGVSLQPSAGAHGELTSLMIIKAYFEQKGEKRTTILIPDTAHGTNPASSSRCGFQARQISSDIRGRIDLAALRSVLTSEIAALMVTNPNTLGLFEDQIAEICDAVHQHGGLVFLDGANFNAILGIVRPADFGADLMHINLHKTFSTPHGGGGPGAGPIVVRDFLAPFLPVPTLEKQGGQIILQYNRPQSIGKVKSFLGNIGVMIKAYCYIRMLGAEGLKMVSEHAVLNANYLLKRLRDIFDVPYDDHCMHEFVVSAKNQKQKGIRALDIAKKLLDEGFHPPTVYFPLIVPEALMIEPTESESKETLDQFADALQRIVEMADSDLRAILEAPLTTPVSRLDEYAAARTPILRWMPSSGSSERL